MKTYLRSLFALVSIIVIVVGCLPVSPASLPVYVPATKLASAPSDLTPAVENALTQLRGLPIEEFFEESFRQIAIRDHDRLIFTEGSYTNLMTGPYAKYNLPNDRFTDISEDYVHETYQLQHAILDLLHTYDRSAMPYDLQVAYDIYDWYLTDLVAGQQFMYYNYPVNGELSWGMSQDSAILYMLIEMRIESFQEAEDYLARLSTMDTWMEQLLESLKRREQAGILPSKFMVRASLAQLDRGYSFDPRSRLTTPEDNILYISFVKRLEDTNAISLEQKHDLSMRVLAEVEQTVIPAWQELQVYMEHMLSIAPEETGAWNLPDGQAYYAYMLRHATATEMTAEQIHQLGLREVARLQDEMRAYAHEELGYPRDISMYEMRKRLMKEAGSPDKMKLLETTQALVDGVEAKKETYFNIYPSKEVIVKLAYPDVVYNDPALNEPGPAIIRYDFESPLPRYELPSWMYHENIPGHLLSQMLFYELDLSAPTFHKTVLIPSYLEGWALYIEELAWEMGLYENDPYGNLGRLEFKILRAARLVTETGIHTKGWTLEDATNYISSATGRPTPPSEATRYIIEPGQGCSYYLGYLKIRELRQRAIDNLGDDFDIREFHDALLKHGQMPLAVMEQVVDDWIEAELRE